MKEIEINSTRDDAIPELEIESEMKDRRPGEWGNYAVGRIPGADDAMELKAGFASGRSYVREG